MDPPDFETAGRFRRPFGRPSYGSASGAAVALAVGVALGAGVALDGAADALATSAVAAEDGLALARGAGAGEQLAVTKR